MNRHARLVRAALHGQREFGLQTPATDLEQLPDDLLTALVDCEGSSEYRLHRFLRLNRETPFCTWTATGEEVEVDRTSVMSGAATVLIYDSSGRKHTAPRTDLKWDSRAVEWWVALVEGSCACLAEALRDFGFQRASADAPFYVVVRPVQRATDQPSFMKNIELPPLWVVYNPTDSVGQDGDWAEGDSPEAAWAAAAERLRACGIAPEDARSAYVTEEIGDIAELLSMDAPRFHALAHQFCIAYRCSWTSIRADTLMHAAIHLRDRAYPLAMVTPEASVARELE